MSDIEFEREISVRCLRSLLRVRAGQLRDTDILKVNRVWNFSVLRDGEYIGFIDIPVAKLVLHSKE